MEMTRGENQRECKKRTAHSVRANQAQTAQPTEITAFKLHNAGHSHDQKYRGKNADRERDGIDMTRGLTMCVFKKPSKHRYLAPSAINIMVSAFNSNEIG